MSKSRLIKRLKWYYPAEKFHAFITFPLLLIYLLFTNPWSSMLFLSYGLIVCTLILYQGQYYWKLKLDRLLGKIIPQEKSIAFFRKSKKLNLFLISIMPLIFIVQLSQQNWNLTQNKIFLWGMIANVFAILEHINYYNIQLMVDNKYDLAYLVKNKRLKISSLAKDLRENKI